MLTKEVDMFVIRRRLQRVDFNGVRRPVFEKQPERLLGKVSRCQSFHEWCAADPFPPALGDLPVDSVDELFGFLGVHFQNHGNSSYTFLRTVSALRKFSGDHTAVASVIPAKAGIQTNPWEQTRIPVCTGITILR